MPQYASESVSAFDGTRSSGDIVRGLDQTVSQILMISLFVMPSETLADCTVE
jgi:hypothetical protein